MEVGPTPRELLRASGRREEWVAFARKAPILRSLESWLGRSLRGGVGFVGCLALGLRKEEAVFKGLVFEGYVFSLFLEGGWEYLCIFLVKMEFLGRS